MRKLTMVLSLVFISIMFSAVVVMADENKAEKATDVEKVFPKDEVQKLIADIEKEEVLPDKETDSVSPARASGSYPRRKGVILATADAYNYNYFNVKTRAKFYCSHLVWASFKDKYKIDLNTSAFGRAVHPLELVSTSKTRTVYKK